jgi:hypothetical protein
LFFNMAHGVRFCMYILIIRKLILFLDGLLCVDWSTCLSLKIYSLSLTNVKIATDFEFFLHKNKPSI